jgi:hypothetical protein
MEVLQEKYEDILIEVWRHESGAWKEEHIRITSFKSKGKDIFEEFWIVHCI